MYTSVVATISEVVIDPDMFTFLFHIFVSFLVFTPVLRCCSLFSFVLLLLFMFVFLFRVQFRDRDQRSGARPRLFVRWSGAEHQGRGETGYP